MQLKNKRLDLIATLIKPCDHVVDVGSDHSWLGINLLLSKKVKFITNIEINALPLANGIKNLSNYNLLDQTNNILNDGLSNLDDLEFDYCTIAGMGAFNIVKIMQQFNNHKTNQQWILQSNSHTHLLRAFLLTNGFEIINEHILFENNHYYFVILAKKVNVNSISDIKKGYHLSSILLAAKDELYHQYLKDRLNYLQTLDQFKISSELRNELEAIEECLSQWK